MERQPLIELHNGLARHAREPIVRKGGESRQVTAREFSFQFPSIAFARVEGWAPYVFILHKLRDLNANIQHHGSRSLPVTFLLMDPTLEYTSRVTKAAGRKCLHNSNSEA